MFSANFLLASLFWGSLGVGILVYGKRQKSVLPLVVGVIMIAVSYLAESALSMSLICSALLALMYILYRQGY
jgi:hypothetical protein